MRRRHAGDTARFRREVLRLQRVLLLLARAAPPSFPSCAAALAGVWSNFSVSSPVAIRMIFTAAPITSAGRFWPRGPLGMIRLVLLFRWQIIERRLYAKGIVSGTPLERLDPGVWRLNKRFFILPIAVTI